MNSYAALKSKHQKEIDAFPLGAAFSNKQFEEMMQKWGLTVNDTDKILRLGDTGCFIRKTDQQTFHEIIERHDAEMKQAIADDKTGNGFIYDMFIYELANHEYCITYDLEETLDALNLTYEEIIADKRLSHGLNKAKKDYLKNSENY